jgi:hypothetical protein
MIEFLVTMHHKCTIQPLPANALHHKGLKGVWELSKKSAELSIVMEMY